MYKKRLCGQCNLNNNCCCQETQKNVDNCGMESVLNYNNKYQELLQSGTLTYEELHN